ncbi:MAG: serine/threonine protein kinase [Planctomycetales bacterium]|nr:serine/threonine protein kinase [Planctomycetales bacterium]
MADPLLNRQLGPYVLRKVVGRGGMGAVYAAEDTQAGGTAAVKVLSPALASDTNFRERFSDEIESLKKLHHPNIVQLLGYGEQDGQLFYAMELIEGASLQEELRQGRRFTWREVVQIGVDICAALKHAHDHGIIHRDLKPANLLYTGDESVKLLDFGIAKLFGNTSVTTDSVMGTADYMSPEQAEGKAVSPRTDLYSLGSVMYALLAGRPPFVGKSVPEVVHKVRFESPVPICRMASDVPVEMEQLIDQLLEKLPQKRIPTALALSHRLRAMEHALSVRPNREAIVDEFETPAGDPGTSSRTRNSSISSNVTVRLDHQALEGEDAHVEVTTQEDEIETGPDRFVTIAEERARQQATSFSWSSLLWLALAIVLTIVAYQTFYFLSRPPSADSLIERMTAEYDETNPRSLVSIERQIDQFLENYPTDRRAEFVSGLRRDLALYRLQRRTEMTARRNGAGSDTAIENLYLQIVQNLHADPTGTRIKLRSLIDLYRGDASADPKNQQYLELAQQQLTRLEALEAQEIELHLPLLRERLDHAKSLLQDDPQAARQILTGLLDLYSSKPWAQEATATARELLGQIEPTPSSESRHVTSGELAN